MDIAARYNATFDPGLWGELVSKWRSSQTSSEFGPMARLWRDGVLET